MLHRCSGRVSSARRHGRGVSVDDAWQVRPRCGVRRRAHHPRRTRRLGPIRLLRTEARFGRARQHRLVDGGRHRCRWVRRSRGIRPNLERVPAARARLGAVTAPAALVGLVGDRGGRTCQIVFPAIATRAQPSPGPRCRGSASRGAVGFRWAPRSRRRRRRHQHPAPRAVAAEARPPLSRGALLLPRCDLRALADPRLAERWSPPRAAG